MSVSEAVAGTLLLIGVASFAFTSIGLLVSRNVYDQIHFLAPGSIVGSVAICAAVVVHEGFSQSAVKAILVVILLLISNPILSHATARAARVRREQKLPLKAADD